jgi:hypothetical protein
MTALDSLNKKGAKGPASSSSSNGKNGGKFKGSDKNARPSQKMRRPAPAKTGEGDSKDKKSKKAQPKRKKKKAGKKNDRVRDFSGDLETYLEEWEQREADGAAAWKFNKILQAWALDNCFYKKKVSSGLFKQLIPYLLTVQGGAMDRLVSRAAGLVSTDKADIIDDDESLMPSGADAAKAAEGDDNDADEAGDEEEDEEGAAKKKEVVYKSMVSRARKLQKALNA